MERRNGKKFDTPNSEENVEALKKYGRDLVQDVRDGKIDPIIGRDDEIRRVIQILSRKTKNNPVLIGEPVLVNSRCRRNCLANHERGCSRVFKRKKID